MVLRTIAILAAVVASIPPTFADQAILGHRLEVRDPKPGVDPTKRKVVLSGKETLSPDVIVGDPSQTGAELAFFLAASGTGDTQYFFLPRQAGRRPGALCLRGCERSLRSGARSAAQEIEPRLVPDQSGRSRQPAGSRSHRCPRRTHACSSPSSTVTPTTVLPAGGLLLRRDGELDGRPLVFPERLSRRERWQLRHQCRVRPWRNLRAPVATTDAVTTPIYEVVRCERLRAKCSR
jgi:hypothetical protein